MIGLTDSELLVLGLLAEMPRHGYELEQVIEQRGMREWTPIGFSSIYFVLSKLEKKQLLAAQKPNAAKARKRYSITKQGRSALVSQTLSAISNYRPAYSSLLLGVAHWPVLTRKQALEALGSRKQAVTREIQRLEAIHFEQQPLPDYMDVLFDYSIGQLTTERDWITKTLAYMKTKPWDD